MTFAPALLESGFAIGATAYLDHYPGHLESRIVLTVTLAGRRTTAAVVDTAAPWCVLDPELAESIREHIISEDLTTRTLSIRGTEYPGRLSRIRLGLQVDVGESREIEATVFVPTLPPGDSWLLPNFLGLTGFLERIRFAVDPAENRFFFAPV